MNNRSRHRVRESLKRRVNRCPSTSDLSFESISLVSQDEEESDFLREVWEPSGRALHFLQIEAAFIQAGYTVRKMELSPHTPPVAVFRLSHGTVARFFDDAQFNHYIRQILKSVEINVSKSDLVAQRNRDNTLVAFVWQSPAIG